ncbi:MAG: glycosyltransferase, partial [Bacteroidales bacterium]|nr:glycosyltransferase [Bacteroidales bacterium]
MNNNIGLFNESFPPVMDGVAVCVENYARWMQEKVGGVSVITPHNPGADYSDKPYEVLDYLSVPVPFRKPYVTGLSEVDPLFMRQLLRRKFKIVHAHSPFIAGRTASHVAYVQKIPLVATFHSKYREDFARVVPGGIVVDTLIKDIVRFYKRADVVWVPQESVKDVLYSYGYKGQVDVMPNGCDLAGDYPESFFSESRAALGLKDGEFTLLYVGQHIWEKNLRLTLEALGRIKDIPYHMFFIGTGYAEKEMQEMTDRLGIRDHVSFIGRVTDREKLKQYYAAADLFLFPSLYDTDGLVVREAAALNTPSVMLKEASAAGMLTDGETGFKIAGTLD